MTLIRFACACVAALATLVGGAAAAPTWRPPLRLSPVDGGPSVQSPKVATNAAGTSVVVWERAGSVQAISRPARSAAWSRPVDLAAGRGPLVAIDAAGGAVVAYTTGGFPSVTGQAVSRRSATSEWEAPVTLSPRANMEATDVAVNARGDAVVGLNGFSGQGYVAEAAYRAAGSAWQPAVQLSDPGGNSPRGADVAIDAAGNAVAVWVRAGPGAENPVVMASFRRAASGVWEPAIPLGGPYADAFPEVAMDPAGNAVAAWTATRATAGTVTTSVEASFRPATGAWSSPAALSTPTGVASDLELGFSANGNALVTWVQVRPGESSQVQAAARAAGSDAWQATVDVTPPEPGHFVSGLDLAVDPAGNAVAAWVSGPVRAALRPVASGTWQPPGDVAAPTGGTSSVEIAMDGSGNALAIWPTSISPTAVEASELDGTGPLFERVEVPANAVARVQVGMSAQAVPWASALAGAPRWSFGDGWSAEGASVRHVYAAPGTYTISVTQADVAGGTTTATRMIAVAAPTLSNRARPSIRGRPRVGARLLCFRGRWAGTPPIRFAYSWLRNGRRVSTGPSRRLRGSDAGSLVSCRVRASNPAGSAVATSRPVRVRR